ncbi:MAG: hypothetical protein ACREQI_00575 [Candidatus Binataceae bacterium]
MRTIHKKIVVDEAARPVAVQIDYREWLKIEQTLNPSRRRAQPADLSRHAGSIRLTKDPLAYQNRLRGEWS